MNTTIAEAAQVLLDDINGLTQMDRIGQINPVAIRNLENALGVARKAKKPGRPR